MRCCASPTTSPAADAPRALVQALLFREILKPLAAPLGPVGETALSAVVDRLFVPEVRR